MNYTKSFQGSNACFVQRDGISPLQFVQIPDGRFALILDDLPVEISMKLPRPDGEDKFWICEMTIAYGEVVKAEAKNLPKPEPDLSGVREKPKAGELSWMSVAMHEAMMEGRRSRREKRAAG